MLPTSGLYRVKLYKNELAMVLTRNLKLGNGEKDMLKVLRPSTSIPVLLTLAVAMLGFWGFTTRSASPSGTEESARIIGLIEFTILDANGNLKEHRIIHNTTLAGFKNSARDRLGVDGSLTSVSNTDLYDNIQLCSNDVSGDASTCTLSANLDANPADGANTSGGTGVYSTVKTFTASGASTIEEMQLTRGSAVNATKDTNVGAWQNVSITLANTDTLQVTWTVTIS